MNKLWVAVIVVFVCVIGILGIYYESQVEPEVEPEIEPEIEPGAESGYSMAGDIISLKNVSYTDTELQELYEKYDIKENDLKFARGELPNYLEGTIFQSNSRVIVSETGEPPEGLVEGEHYDVVMSEQEMSKIMEEARVAYIEKYGVDPANPKIDEVNGYLIPKQEARRLVFFDMGTVVE